MTRPKMATIIMTQFFVSIEVLGPSGVPHAHTNWITGGKINANADEHNAPINERKKFSFGTISATTTVNQTRKMDH